MKKNGMRPVPPGEILNEEFLKPLGLTANALAKAIGVPPNRITAILKERRTKPSIKKLSSSTKMKEASQGTRRSGWEPFSKRRRNSG